jgi:hypothetical protein
LTRFRDYPAVVLRVSRGTVGRVAAVAVVVHLPTGSNAQADLVRKRQVRSSNLRVPWRNERLDFAQSRGSVALGCGLVRESDGTPLQLDSDTLIGRDFDGSPRSGHRASWRVLPKQNVAGSNPVSRSRLST